jgi:hypothetical protein
VFVDPIEIGFLAGVREVAFFDLFVDVTIDQALKSNGLSQGQSVVDFEPETFGRTPGIRLRRIIFDCTESYRRSRR